MFGFLTGLLPAMGGLFGILGSLATTWLKQRAVQADHVRELERTRLQIEVAKEKGSWEGLQSSQQAAAEISKNSNRWSNDIKNLFRPFITTVLVIGSYFIFRDLMSAITGAKAVEETMVAKVFDFNEMVNLVRYYVNSMVFSTSAAIMWWFGDRAQKPPGLRNL